MAQLYTAKEFMAHYLKPLRRTAFALAAVLCNSVAVAFPAAAQTVTFEDCRRMLNPQAVLKDMRTTLAVVDPALGKKWDAPDSLEILQGAGIAFRLHAVTYLYNKYNRPAGLEKYVACTKYEKQIKKLDR